MGHIRNIQDGSYCNRFNSFFPPLGSKGSIYRGFCFKAFTETVMLLIENLTHDPIPRTCWQVEQFALRFKTEELVGCSAAAARAAPCGA